MHAKHLIAIVAVILVVTGVKLTQLKSVEAQYVHAQPGRFIGETVTPGLSSLTTITGTSRLQSVSVLATAPAALTRPPFAFGFLEFDWDPNAPGGVPGFDSWPNRELRIVEASASN